MSNDRISFDISAEDVAGRTFTPADEGWYDVTIDNVEEAASQSAKNPGKPMYKVFFKSTDEKFSGTQLTYACLWYEARFAIMDIMKATGFPVEAGKLDIPESDDFIGKELQIFLAVEDYTNKEGEPAKRNAVKKFKALGGATIKKPAAKKGAGKGGFAL